jgi:hypothetical protein
MKQFFAALLPIILFKVGVEARNDQPVEIRLEHDALSEAPSGNGRVDGKT